MENTMLMLNKLTDNYINNKFSSLRLQKTMATENVWFLHFIVKLLFSLQLNHTRVHLEL